jgi:hypothetical protein
MNPFQVWCCTERALKLKLGSLRNIEILALFHGPWWWICRYGAEVRYKPGKLKFAYGPVAETLRTVAEENAMLIITDSQKVALSIKPVTKAGNPAPVDGKPVWSLGCEDHLKLEVSEDGLSVVISSLGKLGVCQVNVSADADLGEGVEAIAGTVDIEVKAGKAVSVGIEAGVPEEIG